MGDATTTEQSTGDLADFPTRWHTGLALVAHPDDPEYGMSAAVARWVGEGKRIVYALASSGEKGIAGMDPDEAGPLREQEQREAASIVGVDEVEFWGFPDSDIANSEALRARITETIMAVDPDVIISLFGGDHWHPARPTNATTSSSPLRSSTPTTRSYRAHISGGCSRTVRTPAMPSRSATRSRLQ